MTHARTNAQLRDPGSTDAGLAESQAIGAERPLLIARLAASLGRDLAAAETAGPEALALCVPMALLVACHMRFDAADPRWPDRDRLIIAASAAGLGEAAARLLGSGPGLSQSPSQALGAAAGLALAERMLASRFGRSLVDHRTWMLGGGAELATGPVQEAACLAGQWRLGRLTVIAAVASAEMPGLSGFAANGWAIRRTRGGDAGEAAAALSAAARSLKPTLILCVTQPATGEAALSGDATPAWAAAGRRSAGARHSWLKRLTRHASRYEFDQAMEGRLPPRWHSPISEPISPNPPQQPVSTAQAVEQAIAQLAPGLANLAVLPSGPGWSLPAMHAEPAAARALCSQLTQASAAIALGLALHGGLIPISAYRLDDVTRVQPALHDAVREELRLTQLFIEPCIPCPVADQHAALHAVRDLAVFRPADAAEAVECFELALRRRSGPSVLLLSDVPGPLAGEPGSRLRSARGGYLLAEPARRSVTLIASGAELHLAKQVSTVLAAFGLSAAVLSLPCWHLFAQQDPDWVASMLGAAPRFGIDSSGGFGWERWLGGSGRFIGVPPGQLNAAGEPHRIADMIRRHLEEPPAL